MTWFWNKKKPKNNQPENNTSANKSVALYAQGVNNKTFEKSVERKEALAKLETALTHEERFDNLVKTYRHGKDLLVIPTTWQGHVILESFRGKVLFVDTTQPSIVRTH